MPILHEKCITIKKLHITAITKQKQQQQQQYDTNKNADKNVIVNKIYEQLLIYQFFV